MIKLSVYAVLELSLGALLFWALSTFVPGVTCLMLPFLFVAVFPMARYLHSMNDRIVDAGGRIEVFSLSELMRPRNEAFSTWLWGHLVLFGVLGLLIFAIAPGGFTHYGLIAGGLLLANGINTWFFIYR